MRKKLTDRFLQSVQPPACGRHVYVDDTAGLELRVSPNGSKSWSIRYRLRGKKQQRSSYSTYPTISLQEARARAKAIAAAAAHGIDLPEQEKRQREDENKAAKRPQTLAALLDQYVESYAKPNQRQWKLVAAIFENHVKPAIGHKSLGELRRADLVELLDSLQNKKAFGAQTNRARSHLMHALNWAIEHEFLEVNPFAGVKRRKVERRRERVLSDDELRAIWAAADKLSEPSRSYIKALILTGQRRDELRLMDWSEIDLPRAVWVLPGARNKSKCDHEVPLSPSMLTLIADRPRKSGPVFSVDGQRPYGGQGWLKTSLDRSSGVSGWVFHDIRRTVASGLAALHVAQDILDRVLGHSQPRLARTYNVFAYADAKRKALELWAERVAIITGEGRDAPNVVALAVGT